MKRFQLYFLIFIVSGILVLILTDDKLVSIAIGIFSTALFVVIDHVVTIYNRLWLAFLCHTFYRKSYIRFSISYLYKIKVNDLYLLVRGHRVNDQFQPVGGVFKRFKASNSLFKKLRILDDEHMPIDNISKDDLRVLVPGTSVISFLNWYNSRSDREVNPEREFKEELVNTGILSKENFSHIQYHFLRTHETKISYSDHFQCREILIAEIYEVDLNAEQKLELENLISDDSDKYTFLDASTIRKKGYEKRRHIRISNTSEWIL